MDLAKQVKGFLDQTDPKKYCTYAAYVGDRVKHGKMPISPQDWDSIFSIVGNRKIMPTDVPKQWISNMRKALDSKQ